MSRTPTPGELLEIRRVKAMVAVTGSTISPQCFQGPPGPPGPSGTSFLSSYQIYVAPNGSDTEGNGSANSPFQTITKALTVRSTSYSGAVNVGIYLYSGIYTESFIIPSYTAIRGMSVQTTIIQLLNVTANTTLVTMGTQTRLEDVTLVLTSSAHWTLKGIVFPGDTTVTSKLRTAVVSVNNSTANSTGSSTVIGVECNGTGTLSTSSFSFNCIKGSTINVYSNGAGIKRGILVSNTNIVTTRDTNIYVARPTNTTSLGSYVGVETNDPLSTGSIQLRSTTVGVVKPSAGHSYTASDILQTTPTSITDPTYLASAGIQLGPGVDLVTKSAGTKGLSTYVYPTTIYYGLRGNLRDGAAPAADAYMWPGTQAVSSLFPDTDLTTPAFYYIQQPAILSGLRVACQTGPGAGYSTTVTIRRTPVGGSIADTVFTITLNDTETTKTFYNGSVDFAVGDKVHVLIKYTGAGSTNLTHDISVQIDFF